MRGSLMRSPPGSDRREGVRKLAGKDAGPPARARLSSLHAGRCIMPQCQLLGDLQRAPS